MLLYTIKLTLINAIAFIASLGTIIGHFKDASAGYFIEVIIITAAIALNTVIMVTILLFTKFHIELVINNQTTL